MNEPYTLIEHLKELRSRIIKSLVFIIASSCVLYGFIDALLPILVKPVGKLIFIAPQEAFISRIKIAFFGGIFLSSPFVIYQIWKFVSTGLKPEEKKYTLIFGFLSFIFFIAGSFFGYFVIVPIGIKFLLGFAADFMVPMITVSKYLSFLGTLTSAFGVIFQLPLISLFLTKIGVVTPDFLSGKRKHAVVLIFILAATLTPPDVVTQCLMAGPLLVLYEIGIIFSKFAYHPV
ncbi:MAG: twin-arginine translocase subunit TatC [Candidatus Omnitrophota bacterium]|nr:twin-arginine translocase subunit TatC [Candidatus Omnitrophota bacterium]